MPGYAAALWISALPALQPTAPAVTTLERLFALAGGIESRLQLAGEAWRMFLEAPLLGAGYGQFAWHHYLWSPPAGATEGLQELLARMDASPSLRVIVFESSNPR